MVAELRGPRAAKPITLELAQRLAPRIIKLSVRSTTRFWKRTACYEMPAYGKANGYSYIAVQVDGVKSYYSVHRAMYVLENGPIAEGLTIDHLCENPGCWRASHLAAVPHAVNVLRSSTNPFALHAQQTHCTNGHELPERTLEKSAKRRCATCLRAKSLRRSIKRRTEDGA